MRDRNQLSYQQFHIQLEKNILLGLQEFGTRRNSFSQELSLEFRPDILHPEPVIRYRKDYRLLRSLVILQWYFPETLHFFTYLSLEEENFNWLSKKQQIELKVLLSSKDNCIKYLYLTERYTGNEIFGNILGNDLRDLSRNFVVSIRKYPIPRKKIYRRGPKDKGSRRVISQGPFFEDDVRRDIWILIEEEKFLRKKETIHKVTNRVIKVLENLDLSK